jgi:pantoate ligase / CMP/dCMP kinase
MLVISNVIDLRNALKKFKLQAKEIGLVPTMGALHQGHASLITRAINECDVVVVSIFVNPLQFAPSEDLAKYPRTLEADYQLCAELGVAIVFAPSNTEIGVTGDTKTQASTTTVISPESMTSGLCGKYRPGHFTGVATIVTKLLNIGQCDRVYFGQKDAQQLAIIRRLAIDLNFPVEIVGCPIIREESGLALSSRNQYLTATEKTQASIIYHSLHQAAIAFSQGVKEATALLNLVKQHLATVPEIKLQYVELVEPETLQPLLMVEKTGLIAIAAYLGTTRLIDNMMLREPIIAIDGPAGAGKSTVTRRLAQELGLLYLDTGAMYRAVTWLVMDAGIAIDDESAIASLVQGVQIDLIPPSTPNRTSEKFFDTGFCPPSPPSLGGIKVENPPIYPQCWGSRGQGDLGGLNITNDTFQTISNLPTAVYINRQEVTQAIRTPEVTSNVSAISAQVAVRKELVKIQQNYGIKGGIIAEGRDIGTNVFPDAELKIFLTASPQERAKRRIQDLQNQGYKNIDLQQLEREIIDRDNKDSQRAIAPLEKADDAIEIITDNLTIEQVIKKIVELYSKL